MELMLQVQSSGDSIALVCNGQLIYGDETEALHAALGRLLLTSSRVVVNLQNVRKMDCAALGVLADAARRAGLRGGTLELCSVPRNLKKLLEVTRLHLAIPMLDSQPEAGISQAFAA